MAVGYHKLNSSAARSRRSAANNAGQSPAPPVVPAGTAFNDPTYGACSTIQDFVSDSDTVECSTQNRGIITLTGRWVRANIKHS
jgi:hypothetical protein